MPPSPPGFWIDLLRLRLFRRVNSMFMPQGFSRAATSAAAVAAAPRRQQNPRLFSKFWAKPLRKKSKF